MKFVMETLRKQEEKELLPVIKLEIDYELMTLYDAMQNNDTVLKIKTKEKLKQLRKRLLELSNDEESQ